MYTTTSNADRMGQADMQALKGLCGLGVRRKGEWKPESGTWMEVSLGLGWLFDTLIDANFVFDSARRYLCGF